MSEDAAQDTHNKHGHFIEHTHDKVSLSEVNQSIDVPESDSFWKNFFAFLGPGALVAVGYMDPGNWITSVVGGATYKYALLSVILISSVVAMQLQHMSGKLGMVTRQDLAQHIAQRSPQWARWILFVIIELALIATDFAEVLGSAIALHLLFGIPLMVAIVITVLDVVVLLSLMRLGFRKIEAIVAALILTIVIIFGYLVILARPHIPDMLWGFVPSADKVAGLDKRNQATMLALALGIIGATVMPHNLYLHSSIVQTRKVNTASPQELDKAVRFMTWDSNVQLTVAFVVNSLLLIVGASIFYGHAHEVTAFKEMYNALANPAIAGVIASKLLATLFAIALLASGQNSTITGTLTGQIVLEGFVHVRVPQWAIRLGTRVITLVPVIIIAALSHGHEQTLDNMIVYSQVFLSLALPFSIFPLIYFTSKKSIMGKYANAKWNTIIGYLVAIILTVLNIQLIMSVF
ncbi:divalent metal cation transporter [Alloscardovia theropitheci]|uniref:Divalent metal cation transporter MntH n=1 Tax=Alloscardovia theropitheci TaxID=2496842 RepID=A0A4R0QX16_9BIFI|nr:Nramp family divalent metal transporter [Alloscardovia theropitheci]TCD55037.1 divalent metal cation transporter [Alloscardovia theropitheci]